MAKLFISHASQDKEIARQLSNDLRVLGHSVWLDEWSIIVGQCISNEIEKALADTHFLILLLSKNAVVSRWVDTEWRAAYWDELQSRSIIVLPVLLEKVQLPKLLQTKKYASFALSYAVGFRELVNAIAHYESSSSIKSAPAQRRRERKKQCEDVERKVERTTTLRLVKDPGADTEPQLGNVINIGGTVTGSIVANKVQISGKRMPRMNYPIGSVGASVQMKNYLDYLIKRYYDYRKADTSFAAVRHSQRFHPAEIHTSIQSKFKAKTFFVPESQFEQECAYIKARIDRTILGKRNKGQGVRNYSSFEDYTEIN